MRDSYVEIFMSSIEYITAMKFLPHIYLVAVQDEVEVLSLHFEVEPATQLILLCKEKNSEFLHA